MWSSRDSLVAIPIPLGNYAEDVIAQLREDGFDAAPREHETTATSGMIDSMMRIYRFESSDIDAHTLAYYRGKIRWDLNQSPITIVIVHGCDCNEKRTRLFDTVNDPGFFAKLGITMSVNIDRFFVPLPVVHDAEMEIFLGPRLTG